MITVQGLQAGYGKLFVLNDISHTFPKGEFTAILGPNGSGKSTLLKSIFGITSVFSGKITIDEKNLVGVPTEKISSYGIAYIPQRQNIFTGLTVLENLMLVTRKYPKAETQRLLAEINELFPILMKRSSQPAGQLSGGERQMVAIALGWLLKPQVMLLDEPSAGLSPRFAIEVFRVLQQLAHQGMTLIVVEQNARRVLDWCEKVCILREGQIVFTGTAEECRNDEHTVKNYLGVYSHKTI